MTKSEFIEKIEKGDDIEFNVRGKGYTIFTWTQNTTGKITIGEHHKPESTEYGTAKELIEQFLVDGVPLEDMVSEIVITNYTGLLWDE